MSVLLKIATFILILTFGSYLGGIICLYIVLFWNAACDCNPSGPSRCAQMIQLETFKRAEYLFQATDNPFKSSQMLTTQFEMIYIATKE